MLSADDVMSGVIQAGLEHFELLKRQWSENMELLRNLVDDATDSAAFIKACGDVITSAC